MPELILRSLPYCRDTAQLIGLMAQLPDAIVLDSGLGGQHEGRYDILSACPSTQLRLVDVVHPGPAAKVAARVAARVQTKTLGCSQGWKDVAQDCVFEACDLLLQTEKPTSGALAQLSHLPFCGGLIGYLGYNAGEDTLSPLSKDKLTEDRIRLERIPTAMIGLYHWALIVDHHLQQAQYFILPECPDEIRGHALTWLSSLENLPDDKQQAEPFELLAAFSALTDGDEYKRAFGTLKEYIFAGDCYQVNLAIPFSASFRGRPEHAYQVLRQRSHSPFSAWFKHTGSGLDEGDDSPFSVLSMSPERFLSVKDQHVCTQPIKGTRKRSTDSIEDLRLQKELQQSDKDRAENLMIVDLLRNDLGRVCKTGSVKTDELFRLHSFSHVHHLISTVTGELRAEVTPMMLLKHCFPGGSITGAPKIRAMQIIAELEPLPRSVYCGSMMYCDFTGHMDSSICIRTLVAIQNTIYCWGGGGIVADSECAREHQECLDKVSALMSALPLTSTSA